MAKIPGWAYAAVGVAVALYSKFVQSRNGSKVMSFFFWVGILILIFGVFKLVLSFITGKRERTPATRPSTPPGANYIICPRCNAKLHPQSRYCNWCGTKLV